MNTFLVIAGIGLVTCLFATRIFSRIGVPALLAFILLGMLFGEDGPVGISFSNYELCKNVATIGLIFIMFYGGFGAKWSVARPNAVEALALASLGTIVTAGVVALGAHLVLGMSLPESFLIGAVISSTDAASVFAVLRAQRLNLKDGLASVLEVESGSNDPFAYLLTFVALLVVQGAATPGDVASTLAIQLLVGAGCGVGIALLTCLVMPRLTARDDAMAPVLLIAVSLLAFSVPESFGGNGFLAVYLAGLIIGNSGRVGGKTSIVHFFDGLTHMAQIMIFFLFGLLTFPSSMLSVLPQGIAIFLVLTFVARPIAVTLVSRPFGRGLRPLAFMSAAGLRGAASLTFALIALEALSGTGPAHGFGMYHTVMWVVILSILLQGPMLPFCARKLGLVDDTESVMRTFNDYEEQSAYSLMQLSVREDGSWNGSPLSEAGLPSGCLVILIRRAGQDIVPHGSTVLQAGDQLVISAPSYTTQDSDAQQGASQGAGQAAPEERGLRRLRGLWGSDGNKATMSETPLRELALRAGHPWVGKTLATVPLAPEGLAVLIKRGSESLLPHGTTVLQEGDVIVYSGALPAGVPGVPAPAR